MEQDNPIAKKLKYLILVILLVFLSAYYGSVIMMMINTFSLYDGGCWFRYTNTNGVLTTNVLSNLTSLKVKGNANYKSIGVTVGSNVYYVPDPRYYGQYVGSAPMSINAGSTTVTLGISGTVSLCRSYLPAYDLQSGNSTQQNLSGAAAIAAAGTVTAQSIAAAATAARNANLAGGGAPAVQSTNSGIPIPRVGEPGSLALRFPSNTGNWRNIVELFAGDSIQLVVGDPASNTNVSNLSTTNGPTDPFNGSSMVADCNATTTPYVIVPSVGATSGNDTIVPYGMKPDPICGRFTPYANTNYISSCYSHRTTTCGSYTGQGGVSCGNRVENIHHNYDDYAHITCNTVLNASGDGCQAGSDTHDSGTDYCCENANNAMSQRTDTYTRTSPAPTAFTDGAFAAANPQGGRVFSSIPAGSPNIFPHSNNVRDYLLNYNSTVCSLSPPYSNAPFDNLANDPVLVTNNNAIIAASNNYNFWLTQGNGLMLQLSTTGVVPGSIVNVTGISFQNDLPGPVVMPQMPLAGVPTTPGSNITPLGNILYSNASVQPNAISGALGGFLQLGYIDDGNPTTHNAGGYTIYVNHTKCQRSNGQSSDDSYYSGRGQVKYVIAPTACDINASPQCPPGWTILQSGVLDFQGGQTINLTINNNAQFQLSKVRMWFLIDNKATDYQDSMGEYDISIGQQEAVGQFSGLILVPLMNQVQGLINNAGTQMFQNLTCYGLADTTKCLDFFKYIRALLTLYIFIFGAMFALGKIQLNQKEFLTHAIKVIVIGGLLNGNTFNFFSANVFPFVFGFSGEIIANFGGYSGVDPFTFLDEVMDKLIFSKLALFQMLALISGGITGLAMFMMTAISIMIFISSVFQALCIYIFAQLILSFLIGISPLFLTFMLFKETKDLFQKWLNNVIKYMLEPVIVVLGLAIFTKLFAVYMDNVLGYSVCFKCAIPFKIPTLLTSVVPGFPPELMNIELFCFYWFGPWGVDSSLGLISLPIPYIIGMGLIAFCNYTYIGMVPGIVSALTGITTQTSPTQMGVEAAKDFGKAAMATGQGARQVTESIKKRLPVGNKEKATAKPSPANKTESKIKAATGAKPGAAGASGAAGAKPSMPESFESKAQNRTAKGGGMDAIMAKRAALGKGLGGKKPSMPESFESKAQNRTAKGGGMDAILAKRAALGKGLGGKKP